MLYPKWLDLYKVIGLINLLLIIGFMIDANLIISKTKANIIKIMLCILILLMFNKNLIVNYFPNINEFQAQSKKIRKIAYIIEKLALVEKTNEVIIPKEILMDNFDDNEYLLFLDRYHPTCGFDQYITNVHPQKKNIVFRYSENYDYNEFFTKEELETLKFQNLIDGKMYRHQKSTHHCW